MHQLMERDPVCGMMVSPGLAPAQAEHAGKTYYFCCIRCAERFRADPAKYLATGTLAASIAPPPHSNAGPLIQLGRIEPAATAPPKPPPGPSRAIYTCPMDPEVRQDHPGPCPKCGMALEPLTVTADGEPNPELVDMTRRFWISVVLTIPVLALGMSGMIPGQPVQRLLSMRAIGWIELILATPVVLWCGLPFFERGWASLVNRSLNMFTLIALGTGTAYLYSVAAVLFPGAFPASFRAADGQVAIYFEAAAAITTLVLLGQVLELRAR